MPAVDGAARWLLARWRMAQHGDARGNSWRLSPHPPSRGAMVLDTVTALLPPDGAKDGAASDGGSGAGAAPCGSGGGSRPPSPA
eukprot:gene34934-51090_t